MAFAQYYEPVYSKKLNRHTIGEPISRERYQWITANLPKLSNDHNPDLTDGQLEYLLSIKAVFPGKADKAPQNEPETATEHLTHAGIDQGRNEALPRGDR